MKTPLASPRYVRTARYLPTFIPLLGLLLNGLLSPTLGQVITQDAPAEGAVLTSVRPSFEWSPPSGYDYDVQLVIICTEAVYNTHQSETTGLNECPNVSGNPDVYRIILNDAQGNANDTQGTPDTDLADMERYFWRVVGHRRGSGGTNDPANWDTSGHASFRVDTDGTGSGTLPAPTGLTPQGSVPPTTSVTLGWNDVTGAVEYEVEFGSATATVPIANNGTGRTTHTVAVSPGQPYAWNVRGVDQHGIPGRAASASFTVQSPPTGPITLLGPLGNVDTTDPRFTWDLPNDDRYRDLKYLLCSAHPCENPYDADLHFKDLPVETEAYEPVGEPTDLAGQNNEILQPLTVGQTYWWSIAGELRTGNDDWEAAEGSFTVSGDGPPGHPPVRITGRITLQGSETVVPQIPVVVSGVGTVTTDAEGDYAVDVPHGWTGTLRPNHAGYAFQPAEAAPGPVTTPLTINFAAVPQQVTLYNLQPDLSTPTDPEATTLTWACAEGGADCDATQTDIRHLIITDDAMGDFDGTLGFMAALALHGKPIPDSNPAQQLRVGMWVAEGVHDRNYRCPRGDGPQGAYSESPVLGNDYFVCSNLSVPRVPGINDEPVNASFRWVERVVHAAGLSAEVPVYHGTEDPLDESGFNQGGWIASEATFELADYLLANCTLEAPCHIAAGGPLSTVASALKYARDHHPARDPNVAAHVVLSIISVGYDNAGNYVWDGKNMIDDPWGWKAIFEWFPDLKIYHMPTKTGTTQSGGRISQIFDTQLPVSKFRWPNWSNDGDPDYIANAVYRLIRGYEGVTGANGLCEGACADSGNDVPLTRPPTSRWDFNRWYWFQYERNWRTKWWMGDLYTLLPALYGFHESNTADAYVTEYQIRDVPRINPGSETVGTFPGHTMVTFLEVNPQAVMDRYDRLIEAWRHSSVAQALGRYTYRIQVDERDGAGKGQGVTTFPDVDETQFPLSEHMDLTCGTAYAWTVTAFSALAQPVAEADTGFETTSCAEQPVARLKINGRFAAPGEAVTLAVGETLYLDGTASTHTTHYGWTFSDGTTYPDTHGQVSRTWTAPTPQNDPVTLLFTARNADSGLDDALTVTIHVIEPVLNLTALTPDGGEQVDLQTLTLDWRVTATDEPPVPPTCTDPVTLYTGTLAVDTTVSATNIYAGYDFSFSGHLTLEAGETIHLMPGFSTFGASSLWARIEPCDGSTPPDEVSEADYWYDVHLWEADTGISVLDDLGDAADPNIPDPDYFDPALQTLQPNTTYAWFVVAREPHGPRVGVSATATFIILDPAQPQVVGLRDGLTHVSVDWTGEMPPVDQRVPLLVWRGVPNATGYDVVVLTGTGRVRREQSVSGEWLGPDGLAPYLGNTDLFGVVPPGLERYGYLITAGLAKNTAYAWQVRAQLENGSFGPWSSPAWSFTTAPPQAERFYYLTDHLGSVRVTVKDNGQVVHFDDYYPFGLRMPGRSMDAEAPSERFTGHPLDEESGSYYAGARYLDPAVIRWNGIDPLAEKHPDWSPYNYVLANPVSLVDPDGRQDHVSLRQWDPTFLQRWRMSDNIAAQISFGAINEPWILFQTVFLQPFGKTVRRLDGSIPTPNEVRGSLAAAPLGGLTVKSGKIVAHRMDDLVGQMVKGGKSAANDLPDLAYPLNKINPLAGDYNCVNCSFALDNVLEGRPASALLSRGVSLEDVPGIFGKPGFDREFTHAEFLANWVQYQGKGTKGVVVALRDEGPGHAFNVVNIDGRVYFLDAQTGTFANVDDGFNLFFYLQTN